MVEFEECKTCSLPITTNGCIGCDIYKVKCSINDLNNYIKDNSELKFKIFVHSDYYDRVKEFIKSDSNEVISSNHLMDDAIFLIVNDQFFEDYCKWI